MSDALGGVSKAFQMFLDEAPEHAAAGSGSATQSPCSRKDPSGLCATVGAKLLGATRIFAVDALPERLAGACALGADVTIDCKERDPAEEAHDLLANQCDGVLEVAITP